MFSVTWLGVALDELADFYVRVDLTAQRAVAAEVASLNARLAADPTDVGESRGSGLNRIAFHGRVVVRFRVDLTLRTVEVARFKAR